MEPYQAMTFDNRPRAAQFIDGNPMTDGMASFASSLINAPLAVAQIRRQREAEAMDQLWRQRQYDRQTQQDDLARLWHEQNMTRQGRQDELAAKIANANIDNMNADNSRQNMAMFGNGINNAAARGIDMLKLLFSGGKTNESTGWHMDRDSNTWFRANSDGSTEIFDQATKKRIKLGADGMPLDGSPLPTKPAPEKTPKEIRKEEAEKERLLIEKNTAETGYPDREFNFYNPADWFRYPPKAPTTASAAKQKSHSLSVAMRLPINAGKTEEQVRADLVSRGYQITP